MLFILTNDNGTWYEGAWQSLYANNYNKVYKTALKIVIDRELAKDVTQEVFTSAFLKIDTLKDKEKFSAWICTIAENIAKNILKQKITHNSISIYFDDLGDAGIHVNTTINTFQSPETNNPEMVCEANEDANVVLSCIEELDTVAQRILHLKFYEGISYASIAELMDLKESTVRMKALRARKRISEKINNNAEKKCIGIKEPVAV